MNEHLYIFLGAVVAAIPPTLMAFLAWQKGKHVEAAVSKVEVSINGKLREYLELTRKASFAEGVLDQKEKEK